MKIYADRSKSRLARRGGVKRISAQIYDETREVIRSRLRTIIEQVVQVVGMFIKSYLVRKREPVP